MKKLTGISACMFFIITGFGQSQPVDTSNNIAAIVSQYTKERGGQAELYYGIEHIGYSSKIEGFAYFQSPDWQKGSVVYNEVLYTDISLKYDMVADELVVLHANNYFPITLVSEKVQSFSIAGHDFVYLGKNNRYSMKPSFCEKLVTGKLSILVKRSKNVDEKIIDKDLYRKFSDSYEYYAIKDGAAFYISNEDSIMEMLGDNARKVKNYLRNKDIKFRLMKEAALFEIATYYNQLPE
jgi:hypothetical protein